MKQQVLRCAPTYLYTYRYMATTKATQHQICIHTPGEGSGSGESAQRWLGLLPWNLSNKLAVEMELPTGRQQTASSPKCCSGCSSTYDGPQTDCPWPRCFPDLPSPYPRREKCSQTSYRKFIRNYYEFGFGTLSYDDIMRPDLRPDLWRHDHIAPSRGTQRIYQLEYFIL